MSQTSAIEWTEATWNPIVGCSVTSPGCANCYAMPMAARLEAMGLAHYKGTTKPSKAGPVWTGKVAMAPETTLLAPLRRKKPTTYFVNSMSDLFHEAVPDEWIDKVFAVMALCPQHTFQVLTKRSKRMREYLTGENPLVRLHHTAAGDISGDTARQFMPYGNIYSLYLDAPWPLPNCWLGVSAEDQRRFDERWADLRETPAAVTFISMEPLLGPIFFRPAKPNWVIVGGESGPDARPMHPDWARSIRDQCAAAGVAFFFKQWGEWNPFADAKLRHAGIATEMLEAPSGEWDGCTWRLGKRAAGRLLDGREHNDMPRVQA
jgi:protein gp37